MLNVFLIMLQLIEFMKIQPAYHQGNRYLLL